MELARLVPTRCFLKGWALGVIAKILGYVVWVIVAGALLAPPLYLLGQSLIAVSGS